MQELEELTIDLDFILDPSLVFYLPLYHLDGAGFVTRDARGHLCTVVGATWGIQGRTFDGNDDYIDCGAILTDLSTYTIEAWQKINDAAQTNQVIVNLQPGAGIPSFSTLWNASTQAIIYLGGSFYRTFETGLANNGNWHHILFEVLDDNITTTAFEVDGVAQEVASTASAGAPSAKTGLYIGRASTDWLDGDIGEIRIYNRQLTTAEKQHNRLITRWKYQ